MLPLRLFVVKYDVFSAESDAQPAQKRLKKLNDLSDGLKNAPTNRPSTTPADSNAPNLSTTRDYLSLQPKYYYLAFFCLEMIAFRLNKFLYVTYVSNRSVTSTDPKSLNGAAESSLMVKLIEQFSQESEGQISLNRSSPKGRTNSEISQSSSLSKRYVLW